MAEKNHLLQEASLFVNIFVSAEHFDHSLCEGHHLNQRVSGELQPSLISAPLLPAPGSGADLPQAPSPEPAQLHLTTPLIPLQGHHRLMALPGAPRVKPLIIQPSLLHWDSALSSFSEAFPFYTIS